MFVSFSLFFQALSELYFIVNEMFLSHTFFGTTFLSPTLIPHGWWWIQFVIGLLRADIDDISELN